VNVKRLVAEANMRIGAMARATGVSERLLRYYEEQGLLRPGRLASGYREYAAADVTTVRHIRALLAAGLATTVIAKVLPCVREDDERLTPTCPEMITHLHRERARIARAITQLQASHQLLDDVLAAAPATLIRAAN
jgi:DNA-binding transcriptional MerR regulator